MSSQPCAGHWDDLLGDTTIHCPNPAELLLPAHCPSCQTSCAEPMCMSCYQRVSGSGWVIQCTHCRTRATVAEPVRIRCDPDHIPNDQDAERA